MQNEKLRSILQMTSLLFAMVVLFSYIGWFLGYEGFLLVGDIELPRWVRLITTTLLFSANFSLVSSYVLDRYHLDVFKAIIPFVIFYIVHLFIYPTVWVSGPIATAYLICVGVYRGDWKKTLKRAVFISVLTILYQLLSTTIKMGSPLFTHETTFYVGAMFSIDMLIFTILIWAMGGVKYGRTIQLLVCPGRIRDGEFRDDSGAFCPQNDEFLRLTRFEKWIMKSVVMGIQVVQWIFILWVCSIDNLFIEGLVMTTSFICYGMIISRRNHFKPVWLCTLVSTAMFYFIARFTI